MNPGHITRVPVSKVVIGRITQAPVIFWFLAISAFQFLGHSEVLAQTNANAGATRSGLSDWPIINNCSDEYFSPIDQQALLKLKEAALQGDVKAQYEIGARYAEGKGVIPNAAEANRWLSQAAQSGNPKAQRRWGEMLLNGAVDSKGGSNEWLNLLTQAAEQGDVPAQLDLGSLYVQGKEAESNYAKAFPWFLKAAEKDCFAAQNMVGVMYLLGQGVAKDTKVAWTWFEKAAAGDNTEAFRNLGKLHYQGLGVPADSKEAFKWFLKAAEHDDAESQNNLSKMYRAGDGVGQSLAESIKWLERASKNGHPEAQRSLGVSYLTGTGVSKDFAKGKTLLEASGKAGYADAQNDLGILYLSGDAVPTDNRRAYAWMQAAASQGHAAAECNLGIMYQEGIGVPKDEIEALKWYLLSGAGGYREAASRQESLSASLNQQQREEARLRASSFKPQTNRAIHVDDSLPEEGTLKDGFLVVVTSLGKSRQFLLDTGSDCSLFNNSFKELLGKPVAQATRTTQFSYKTEFLLYRCPEIRFGKKNITPDLAGSMDLQILQIANGEAYDGILGMNCLSNYVVQLDCDNHKLCIGGSVPESFLKDSRAIPLKEKPHVHNFVVEVTVNGLGPMDFEIDTGDAGSVSLNEQDWMRVFGDKEARSPISVITNHVNPMVTKTARLQNVTVGANSYHDLIAETYLGSKLPSRLGQLFVQRHSLVIDYPNRTLYLQPGKKYKDPDERDMSGLTILRVAGEMVIDSVKQDSPAFNAGLKPKDRIISINGQDAKSLTVSGLRNLLKSRDGAETALEVNRAGSNSKITFRLKRSI
jgi:TPR repeat protein